MFNTSLNNALTRANSDLIANYPMASAKYDDLTLGASGSTYTAPAAGYFYLGGTMANAGAFIALSNDKIISSQIARDNNNGLGIWLPVAKGDIVTFTTNGNFGANRFRFIYAIGEENNV